MTEPMQTKHAAVAISLDDAVYLTVCHCKVNF